MNIRYITVFMAVTIAPTFRNSINVIVVFILLSNTSKIMMFDAAPRIVRFPAIVEAIASVNHEE